MKEKDLFQKLLEGARCELPPTVNVTERVMGSVRETAFESAVGDAPLNWIAFVSASIALPIALVAAAYWASWKDPLLGVILEIPWGAL
jgi:hypothetical protein